MFLPFVVENFLSKGIAARVKVFIYIFMFQCVLKILLLKDTVL